MPLDSMEDLFLNELKDVYNAEKQILKALPRLAKAADAPALQQAFTKHLRETQLLGYDEADRLLQETLREEEAADKALTAIGEGGINQAAVAAGEEGDEDE